MAIDRRRSKRSLGGARCDRSRRPHEGGDDLLDALIAHHKSGPLCGLSQRPGLGAKRSGSFVTMRCTVPIATSLSESANLNVPMILYLPSSDGAQVTGALAVIIVP